MLCLLFFPPQILNFNTYQKLATTNELNYFNIKDNGPGTNRTKYYFSTDPLKVLKQRIIKQKKEDNTKVYCSIFEQLSAENFIELLNYIFDESRSLAKKSMILHVII